MPCAPARCTWLMSDSRLAQKTYALVWLAGLVALQASPASYERSVSAAFAAGERAMRFVGVLVVLASVISVSRVNGAAVDMAAPSAVDLDLPQDG
jgi:hypothetical protein